MSISVVVSVGDAVPIIDHATRDVKSIRCNQDIHKHRL